MFRREGPCVVTSYILVELNSPDDRTQFKKDASQKMREKDLKEFFKIKEFLFFCFFSIQHSKHKTDSGNVSL